MLVSSVFAQDAETKTPTTKPARKGPRLVQPWSKMESLTDEQKVKIAEIHKKAVADKKQIEEREREDIMALLNDEQKSEVTAMMEKSTAERKMSTKKDAADGPAKPAEKAG